MESDIACGDTSCLLSFLRRRYMRGKNHIYNVQTGKIIAATSIGRSKSRTPEDRTTYVQCEKFRLTSTPDEGNLKLSRRTDEAAINVAARASRRRHKLEKNLSKNSSKQADHSPYFLNELEETSKKIENSFPKCKSLPAEQDYENIRNALRTTFTHFEDLQPLPKRKERSEATEASGPSAHDQCGQVEYEHIKLALRMAFANIADVSTPTVGVEDDDQTESAAREPSLPRRDSKSEAKLQVLVEGMLKSKCRDENVLSRGSSPSPSSSSSLDILASSADSPESSANRRSSDVQNDTDLDAQIKRLEMGYNGVRKRKRTRKRSYVLVAKNYRSSSDEDSVGGVGQTCRLALSEVKTESSLSYGSARASLEPLEVIILQMRDVTEKKKELEKMQTETLAMLRDKQNELQYRSNCSASEKVKLCETIEALQSKNRELEKKMELQNMHYEELQLEMVSVKRSSAKRSSISNAYGTGTSEWKKPSASNQEVQTSPESNTSGCHSNIAPNSSYIDLHIASLDPSSRSCAINNAATYKSFWGQSEPPCTCPISSDHELPSATPSNESACSGDSGVPNVSSTSQNSSLAVDIDKIMAKIDQDNRILAELDKTRSTIATRGSMTAEQLHKLSEMGIITAATCQQLLPTLQAAAAAPMSASQSAIQQSVMLPHTFSSYLQQYDLNSGTRQALGSMYVNHQSQMSQLPTTQPAYSIMQPGYQANYSNLLPFDLEGVRSIKNGNPPESNFASTSDLLLPHEDLIIMDSHSHSFRSQDMVEIPGKGLCNIFIAKYAYDPFSQSTNIYPDTELAINAGDYLLVYGEPDDDGYVDAELMDGRRGLVPIVFIQKLSGDELLDFNQRVLLGMKECDDSASTTIPQDLEHLHHSDEHGKKYRPDYNIGGATEDEDEVDENACVPAPRQLTLERQLNKSILIRWNPPEESPTHCIDSYHVYVDGVLKTTVKASERTKALLEGVDSTRPHRISVRAVTPNRRTSRDAACTMLIGKDVPRYPTNLKASSITPTSAIISWMPSNSNYQHTVCVNNIEIRTVKPGVYRHTITGLVPNTVYRVTIRAKNIRAPQFDDKSASDKFASHLDFRTLPKGMPDPPSEIQVELGPQDGTLLVTWTPVTAENSNGAPITGYAVYADGKKVIDIDSPTGDHALIDISKIISMNPRHVTVRTKSKENHSSDSNATAIPATAIKGKYSSRSANYNRPQARNAYGQLIIDPEENLSDKEVYPGQGATAPAIEIMKENQQDENYSEEEFLETHRSTRNLRYNQLSPRSHHGLSRSHPDRRGPPGPGPNSLHERNSSRANYDSRMYDIRRDNRDYHHHSPNRSVDRRRVIDAHKTGRGTTANRTHVGSSVATMDDKSRLVVALFDYDPENMSPNPSTCHEELPFSAGDQIRLLSDLDPDGFYWGECRGKQGYVPQNMVTELDTTPKMNKRGGVGMRGGQNRYTDIRHSATAKKMVALYDYDPHELSPNPDSDVEISFQQGQIIHVKGEPDDDGFFLGEVDGVQGLVPSNYLQEVEEIPEEMGHHPHPSHGNHRNVIRPLPSRDRDRDRDRNRGLGPGARGPPPPPRDGMPPRGDVRDRRKDTRLQYENQQDQLRMQERIDDAHHLPERITGSRVDPFGTLTMMRENDMTEATLVQNMKRASIGAGTGTGPGPGTGTGVDPNRGSFRTSNRMRGIPNALPTAPTNTKPTNVQTTSGTSGLRFPESPNIMQKLSEMTGSAEHNPVDNIFSKGKELIFMKFGLGK